MTTLKDTSRSRVLSAAEAAVGVLRAAGRLLATLPAAGLQALLAGDMGNIPPRLPPEGLARGPIGLCSWGPRLPSRVSLSSRESVRTAAHLHAGCSLQRPRDAGPPIHSLSWPRGAVPAGSAHGYTRASHTCAFPGCPLGSCSNCSGLDIVYQQIPEKFENAGLLACRLYPKGKRLGEVKTRTFVHCQAGKETQAGLATSVPNCLSQQIHFRAQARPRGGCGLQSHPQWWTRPHIP